MQIIEFEEKNGHTRPQPDANQLEKDAKSKYPVKMFVIACTLIVIGIVLCIVGGMFVLGSTFLTGVKKAAVCSGLDAVDQNSTAKCAYSAEAKRIELPELLALVKTAFFSLHPNHAFWDPDDDDDDERRTKNVKER